jgi:hypothetical protein
MLSGYGIWAQRYPWASQWLWPPIEQGVWWDFAAGVLALVIIAGFIRVFLDNKRVAGFFLLLGTLSVTFALGYADTAALPINMWMVHHVPFWVGFRDSHKWIGVLMAIYVYLYAEGGQVLLERAERGFARGCVYVMLILAPIAYSPYMLVLGWQIQPVDYPKAWYEVNDILKSETARSGDSCTAVFLPWKQYYYLGFNHYILTGNTAPTFFDCTMYTSKDAEHGGTALPATMTDTELKVHATMTFRKSAEVAVGELKTQGIKYIVVTELGTDYADAYWILTASQLVLLYKSGGVALYRLN